MHFFTIAVSAYNHEAFLAQAINSVLAQTWDQWEMVLIDDGSTDATPAIADKYARLDSRIRVIHQPNAGLAAARNTCLQQARGTWIAYLDSDDIWYCDVLSSYAAHIDSHPQAKFIYGYRHRLRGNTVTKLRPLYQDRPTGAVELFTRMHLTPMSVCHRRDLAFECGGYDPALRWCDDYDFYLRASLHCSFEPIGKATGVKRRHAKNLSRPIGQSRAAEADVLRRFVQRDGGSAVLDPSLIARRLSHVYCSAAELYFRQWDFANAALAARESIHWQRSHKASILEHACQLLSGRSGPPVDQPPPSDLRAMPPSNPTDQESIHEGTGA